MATLPYLSLEEIRAPIDSRSGRAYLPAKTRSIGGWLQAVSRVAVNGGLVETGRVETQKAGLVSCLCLPASLHLNAQTHSLIVAQFLACLVVLLGCKCWSTQELRCLSHGGNTHIAS